MANKEENMTAESKTVKYVKTAISAVLILYTFITIFLIGNTVLSSFKSKQELINNTIGFPKKFTLENYYTLLFEKKDDTWYLVGIIHDEWTI